MSKTIITGVLAFVIGLLVAFFWVQQTQVKPLNDKLEAFKNKPQPPPCAQWETLQDGTKVLKVWEKMGPDWPQIAVLQLSNDLYKEFNKEPSTFLNTRKIYPKDVQPRGTLAPAMSVPKTYTGSWLLACVHHQTSPYACGGLAADDLSAKLSEQPH
ncbi:MAG TPA: hypothetical protein VEI54_13155 [Candidatus Limnocylindrales bacterium]|nr:hypothetical protein [Candidatus Limnocylindrales bacterium]